MQREHPQATALIHIILFAFGLAVCSGTMMLWHYLPAICTAANEAREALTG